jgi:hypothetical protein
VSKGEGRRGGKKPLRPPDDKKEGLFFTQKNIG